MSWIAVAAGSDSGSDAAAEADYGHTAAYSGGMKRKKKKQRETVSGTKSISGLTSESILKLRYCQWLKAAWT